MTDEENARFAAAEEALNNPILSEAFEHLASVYARQWAATKPGDQQHREYLFSLQRALKDVELHIQSVAQKGKLNKEQDKKVQPPRKVFDFF